MGGKHKQAQRTKNNTRPSSSGRSAELLGTSIPTFVGFSAVKDGGFVPVIPGFGAVGVDDIDPNIDTNFQLALKKMSKKDAVTKYKALQEFTELVNNCDVEILKTVLPFWPRLYCSLALDAEHKVREAAHIAQKSVALKAKRNLAPYLKQLIGPWFTSQYDNYAPAASAAQLSFQEAFPPTKLPEVIAFCQEEILSYIFDNLAESAVQTPGNNTKNLNEEELESRYQRITVASLQGYALYLRKVLPPQIETAIESNKKLVTSSKFWKLSKHKVPVIRTAWFTALSALLQCAPPSLLETEGQRVTTTVLANLDETDPTVLPIVWETALLALFTVQDWWTHINVEKLVLPKLWRVLRDAAQGNATSIYPNLLPLISKFPPGSDAHAFYSTFFDNIRLGLKQKSVQQSRSELNSVITSFTECLQYVILKNQQDSNLCESLIHNQLMVTIEWTLLEGHFATKIAFSQITNLIYYWSKNRNNSDTPLYNQIIKLFWSDLLTISSKFINDPNYDNDIQLKQQINTKLIEFLFQLKRNTTIKPKKQLKVQFSETPPPGEDLDNIMVDLVDGTAVKMDNDDRTIICELNINVYGICKLYADKVPNGGYVYLQHLYSLIQEFESVALFKFLVKEYELGSIYSLFEEVFNKWIEMDGCGEVIVDLVFNLFKYLDEGQQVQVLKHFSEMNNELSLLRALNHGLAHPYRNMPVIRTWLKTTPITKLLTTCANNIINEQTPTPKNLALLRLACAPDDSGELLIHSEALIEIIHIFSKPLLTPTQFPTILDTCARFASVISAFIYSEENLQTYNIDLLIALFTLSTNKTVGVEILSEDTLWEINTAWQDAISVIRNTHPLESEYFINILNNFAMILKNSLKPSVLHSNSDLVKYGVGLVIEFIKNSCPDSTVGRVGFVYSLFVEHFNIRAGLKVLVKRVFEAELLTGSMVGADGDDLNISGLYPGKLDVEEEVMGLDEAMIFAEFGICLLNKMYEKNEIMDEDDDSDNDDDVETLPLEILIPEMENDIVFHIFNCQILDLYCKYFKMTSSYEPIKSNLSNYKTALTNLLNSLNQEMILQIHSILLENCTTIGFFWSKIYHQFYTEYNPKSLPKKTESELFREGLKLENPNHLYAWLSEFQNKIEIEFINLQNKSQLECLVTVRHFQTDESTTVFTLETLGLIKSIYKRCDILADKDISNKSSKDIQLIVEVIRGLAKIVKKELHHLSSTHWDFIFISLYGWIEAVRKTLKKESNLLILAMTSAIFELFSAVSQCMENLKTDIAAGDAYKKLASEWDEVVSVEVNISIFRVYKQTLSLINHDNYERFLVALQQMSPCLKDISEAVIIRSEVQIKWRDISNELVQYLSSDLIGQQIATVLLFETVICPRLVELDTKIISGETHSSSNQPLSLVMFTPILEKTQLIVESIVHDLRLAEQSCQVKVFTEAFQYSSAYLLSWSILMSMITKASANLRYQYAEWLRDNEYIKILLNNILRLMPESILDPSTQSTPALSKLFEGLPNYNLTDELTSEWIESLACGIFGTTLSLTPALIRQWWSSSESRVSRIIEHITSTFISSYLCNREFQDLTKIAGENMQVKVQRSVRLVIASYTVDDARMEITISLPQNYPLGVVKVDCSQQIGGSSQWRNSIMQLSLLLTHQNGTLMDGLKLWKNNLDKRFDGVEECYICFCVIHAGTYQLPKLSCQTCRKKFHSACLYKWFSTSNKSTCPICRNLF